MVHWINYYDLWKEEIVICYKIYKFSIYSVAYGYTYVLKYSQVKEKWKVTIFLTVEMDVVK